MIAPSNIWPAHRAVDALSMLAATHATLAQADPFALGLAEGRRVAEAEFTSERAAMAELVVSLEALQRPDEARLAALVAQHVARLVRAIAGAAAIDPALLQSRAEALASVMAADAAPYLRLNPADVALIDADRLDIRIIPDPTLPRGTARAQVGETTFEDGVAPALLRMDFAFDALGVAA